MKERENEDKKCKNNTFIYIREEILLNINMYTFRFLVEVISLN